MVEELVSMSVLLLPSLVIMLPKYFNCLIYFISFPLIIILQMGISLSFVITTVNALCVDFQYLAFACFCQFIYYSLK